MHALYETQIWHNSEVQERMTEYWAEVKFKGDERCARW